MATVGNTILTLTDWAKRRDPKGNTDKIIEVLEEDNPVLQDALWIEGNLPTGHRTTIRTSDPSGTWRTVNAGVANEKSTTRQVTETIGMLESYSECDKFLADMNGDTAAFRWSEDQAFISGMGNEAARVIFYGDGSTDTPEEPDGLYHKYASVGDYCISGGGGGNETGQRSIWLVSWHPDAFHLIFPKGSKAGIEADDKGQVTLEDGSGNQYEGYRTHYKYHMGVCLRDYRYCVRVCNIDHTDMAVDGQDPGFQELLVRALNRVQGKKGRQVIYVPRSIRTWMDVQLAKDVNPTLNLMNWYGQPTVGIWGVPVRICDALETQEAVVS